PARFQPAREAGRPAHRDVHDDRPLGGDRRRERSRARAAGRRESQVAVGYAGHPMSELASAVCSITLTQRRRFFWAAWWTAAPCEAPFRKPDASNGGATT